MWQLQAFYKWELSVTGTLSELRGCCFKSQTLTDNLKKKVSLGLATENLMSVFPSSCFLSVHPFHFLNVCCLPNSPALSTLSLCVCLCVSILALCPLPSVSSVRSPAPTSVSVPFPAPRSLQPEHWAATHNPTPALPGSCRYWRAPQWKWTCAGQGAHVREAPLRATPTHETRPADHALQ